MITTSASVLKLLAALVWYCGVVVLVIKSTTLFIASKDLGVNTGALFFAIAVAITVGLIKGKTLFSAICLKNLQRIDSLSKPKIYQFYRPRFFLFLALMITTGVTLGRAAQQNVYFLLGLATIELSVATALFISSFRFFKRSNQ